MSGKLLTIGHGYSASYLAKRLDGWRLWGTTRNEAKTGSIKAQNVSPLLWPHDDLSIALAEATHLLISLPPVEGGDPFLAEFGSKLVELAPKLTWVGYLSTTGVYGDHLGEWVDESTPLAPGTSRGKARANAEIAWMATGLPVHVFRLAGIYGPGRSAIDGLRAGTARRIVKDGQVFSRIHVEDIAQVLHASMKKPSAGRAYNVADDLPAAPQDVVAYAAHLMDVMPPPEVPFEEAGLSEVGRSFYSEGKRVSNARMKSELGVELRYPTYREGLAAILTRA